MDVFDTIIRNARLAGETRPVDVGLRGERVSAVAPRLATAAVAEIDARGGLVSIGLVNGHAHLDKALIADRLPGGARGLLGLEDLRRAIAATTEVKRAFTPEDVAQRTIVAARMAVRGGTTLLRTHVDVDPIVGLTGMRGALAAKEACAPWLDLQVVAFPQEGIFRAPGTEDLLRAACQMGADAIGGIPALDDRPEEHVDLVFRLAREFSRPVDMHVDESDRPEDFTLPYVIQKVRQESVQGQVTVGHISSLSVLPDEVALRTIADLAEARVNVSVNPMIIKITRLRDLLAAGVNVMFGSDNIRDAFNPLGNAQPLGTALLACQLAALGSHEDLEQAFAAISTNAARALGEPGRTVAEGQLADLALFRAATPAEAILDQTPPWAVFKRGRPVPMA